MIHSPFCIIIIYIRSPKRATVAIYLDNWRWFRSISLHLEGIIRIKSLACVYQITEGDSNIAEKSIMLQK